MAVHELELPEATLAQLGRLVALIEASLGGSLRGAILHGSAATAGFAPGRSDLDVLVVAGRRLTTEQRRALGEGLLALSQSPHPIELSVVTEAELERWTHPCAHEFHFGEDRRPDFEQGKVEPRIARDVDLAAHVTVARARGVELLHGFPTRRLPLVPREHYLAAILSDFAWAAPQPDRQDDLLANAARTLAWLESGDILSKTEGLQWCLARGIDATGLVREVTARLWAELFAPESQPGRGT